jgi:Trypsin
MSPRALCAAILTALVACAPGEPPLDDDAEPIRGGTPAERYPESVLVDLMRVTRRAAYCSGVLIAPRTVLTAGHCVYSFDGWRVAAPYASGQTAAAVHGITYDWDNGTGHVDPSEHDLGLVFLDTPIVIPTYPLLSEGPLELGAEVVNVGRIHDGRLSREHLFTSPPVPVVDAAGAGYAYDYVAVDQIEPGDSGGPDFIPDTHTVVAVNSGAGHGTEVLARVDLLAPWIRREVAANGGDVLPVQQADGLLDLESVLARQAGF